MIVRYITVCKRELCNMETATRIRIKDSFQDQQNQFVSFTYLHSIKKKIASDERKTLTKIPTRNCSQQFPQTSAHLGHDEIRKPVSSHLHNWWRIWALGFHQKIQERRKSTPRFERKQEDHNWFCINLYIIFSIKLYIIFTLCISARNVKQLNNI